MSAIHTTLILAVMFLTVFAESVFTGLRSLIGVQLDLLPALMVYAGLTAGLPTVALAALCGGLWFDSLSANPLGVTILPLFAAGFLVHFRRDLILRDQAFAQFVLGLFASLFVPGLTVLLLLTSGNTPMLGWGSLWQWAMMGLCGGIATPILFRVFARLRRTFGYQPVVQTSFRPDREIRRSRRT